MASLWTLRRDLRRLTAVAAMGLAIGACAFLALISYNHALTGSYSRSTYALNRNSEHVAEVDFRPASILRNVRVLTRWSLQETILFAFPFLFLLAAYGLIAEKERRREVWLLAALFVALVVGYMPQTEPSGTHFGERFYFESFFAVAILAARGARLLPSRDRQGAVVPVPALLICIQLFLFALFARHAHDRLQPYAAVRNAVSHLRLIDAVVFLHSGGGFEPRDLNLNGPGWPWALHFYMRGPGPASRAAITCGLHRKGWAVISWDSAARSPRLDEIQSAANCPAASVQ